MIYRCWSSVAYICINKMYMALFFTIKYSHKFAIFTHISRVIYQLVFPQFLFIPSIIFSPPIHPFILSFVLPSTSPLLSP